MTPNERVKAKQYDVILNLIKLRNSLQELENLAKYLGIDLFVAENAEVHAKSASIAIRLEQLSEIWDAQKLKYVGPDNEVTG